MPPATRKSTFAVAGCVASLLAAPVARAQATPSDDPPALPEGPEAPPAPPRYRVDFRAGRVEVDPKLQKLELADEVEVVVGRYRLESERLRVERTSRGVLVDGAGRLALCPCPDAPVTIGFRAATLAPPTDVLIEQPTLYLGDVPVLWLPYLWLRSSDRLGLLPPKVAWRADGGLLLGSGVHAPLGARSTLGLRAAGYLRGGAQVEARLSTPRSETEVRWDHYRQSLLGLDSRASLRGPGAARVNWDVDAIRGPRGRRGLLELEPAARRYDRLAVAAVLARAPVTLGLGARALDARAEPVTELGVAGPFVSLGAGAALGSSGNLAGLTRVQSLSDADGFTESRVDQDLELSLAEVVGPLSLAITARQRSRSRILPDDTSLAAWGGAGARVALPLVRSFGAERPFVHLVEPDAELGLLLASQAAPGALRVLPEGAAAGAFAGARTALGRRGSRSAAELRLAAGAITEVGDPGALDPDLAVKGHVLAADELVAARLDAGVVPDAASLVLISRVRLGRADGLHLAAHAEGSLGGEPLLSRFVDSDRWDAPLLGWFDRPGWSGGGGVVVPWTEWLASTAATEWDLSAGRWLSIRGGTGYRHPCGCLGVVAWAGQRLGRDGVDAWVSLNLLPD